MCELTGRGRCLLWSFRPTVEGEEPLLTSLMAATWATKHRRLRTFMIIAAEGKIAKPNVRVWLEANEDALKGWRVGRRAVEKGSGYNSEESVKDGIEAHKQGQG